MIIWVHFGELLDIYIQICDSCIQTSWRTGLKESKESNHSKDLTKIFFTLDITDPQSFIAVIIFVLCSCI